jgi:hypothetical protein
MIDNGGIWRPRPTAGDVELIGSVARWSRNEMWRVKLATYERIMLPREWRAWRVRLPTGRGRSTANNALRSTRSTQSPERLGGDASPYLEEVDKTGGFTSSLKVTNTTPCFFSSVMTAGRLARVTSGHSCIKITVRSSMPVVQS